MFAIIETGGKQYKVQEGETVFVEKLDVEAGDSVTIDKVLVVANGEDVKVGAPYVEGATVSASVVKNGKEKRDGDLPSFFVGFLLRKLSKYVLFCSVPHKR